MPSQAKFIAIGHGFILDTAIIVFRTKGRFKVQGSWCAGVSVHVGGWVGGWGWMDGCIYACMYVCTYACMHLHMHACTTHACMYVYVYIVIKLGRTDSPGEHYEPHFTGTIMKKI